MSAISIKDLNKYYSKFQALKNVNLEIPRGRIIGLLGKNGAGKSTLMRCILGFLKYDGEISICGDTLKELKENVFNKVAFIPDVSSLDDRLTVKQTIAYVSAMNPSWNQEKAESLLMKSDLPQKQKVKNLSKGMKTKLYLLITLSLDVEILLLDEPTLGLDIVFRKEFFNTILGEFYDETKTIIISTHQVEEVEHILQDIIFIDKGEIILNEDIEQLKATLNIISLPSDRENELDSHNPLYKTKTLGRINAVVNSDVIIEGAEYNTPSLSDIFLAKAGGSNE